jgi:hypothetical protein
VAGPPAEAPPAAHDQPAPQHEPEGVHVA